MTSGNNSQPLTRRQARELARAQQPAAEDATPTPSAEPEPATHHASRRAGTTAVTHAGDEPQITSFTDLIRQVAPSDRPATPSSSFAPPRTGGAPPKSPRMTAAEEDSERTLTRRELRALMEANRSAGATEEAEVIRDESLQPLNPPVGHWSIPQDVDEHLPSTGQPFDQLMSRGVGAGGVPTTTNALILPSIQQGVVAGPIDGTGEIMITGSIDLPRSLGSTGQHPAHFDSSEVDRMLDQVDESAADTSVSPVSASRAVSTHTSTRGVMTPPKNHTVSLPTVLAITAAVMALGVVALFVAGYVLQIF